MQVNVNLNKRNYVISYVARNEVTGEGMFSHTWEKKFPHVGKYFPTGGKMTDYT